MASYFNFKNYVETPQPEGNGAKPMGNLPLARQSSVYSLTFDEFQNTLGGFGKDFGSMNMDELLKNIWTAEETQALTSPSGTGQGSAPSGNFNLQRQGSLTLPRTLSQKTVDEVWKDLIKESSGGKDGSGNGEASHLQLQREPTLGEMTLEEFLARAGVVREDVQPIARPTTSGFFGGLLSQPNNSNTGLMLGFQQSAQNNVVMANRTLENKNLISQNVSGVRSSQQQLQQPPQPHPIFPKQANVAFASSMPLVNNAPVGNMGPRDLVRTVVPSRNNGLVQTNVMQTVVVDMTGLGSPVSQLSSDGIAKSNVDTSSVSPTQYPSSGGVRGKKCGGTMEKAMERRHRRMIKNRESAARSRARKQAYTLELEAEVAKLKEMNQELERKQEEIMEMQKNQILEKMKMPWGSKRLCLRRTLTGPW